MRLRLTRVIPCLICLFLGGLLYNSCEETKQLRENLKQVEIENSDLTSKLQQINQKNDSLLLNISDLEDQIVDLEGKYNKAKNRKEILVEKVKYVEVTNDTIENLMLLNQVNDTIIRNLEKLEIVKDSIIQKQKLVIQNNEKTVDLLKDRIDRYNEIITKQNKELISERKKKTFWQCTTAGAGLVALIALI